MLFNFDEFGTLKDINHSSGTQKPILKFIA